MITVATSSPAQTSALAEALAERAAPGDVLLLVGDLGAGKTAFSKAYGKALGVDEPMTSPTFTLAREYSGRLPLHHLDVYRLDNADQALDLDLPELAEGGVTVIEWGEKIAAVLPADRLTIEFCYPPLTTAKVGLDQRTLHLSLMGPSGVKRISALAAALDQWTTSC